MYVYLIKSGYNKTSPVKVGYTKDIDQRIKTLQTGNPVKLQIEALIKCTDENHARRVERSIHLMLHKQNVRNEWFKVRGSQLPCILKRLSEGDFSEIVDLDYSLTQYSDSAGERKYRKKYRALLKQYKELEYSYRKLKDKRKQPLSE